VPTCSVRVVLGSRLDLSVGLARHLLNAERELKVFERHADAVITGRVRADMAAGQFKEKVEQGLSSYPCMIWRPCLRHILHIKWIHTNQTKLT
jgi:hypothetical protein